MLCSTVLQQHDWHQQQQQHKQRENPIGPDNVLQYRNCQYLPNEYFGLHVYVH
jgi:hypothetical protein